MQNETPVVCLRLHFCSSGGELRAKNAETYRYSSVFVENDLQQVRREYGGRFELLLLFRNIGLLVIRSGGRAGEV